MLPHDVASKSRRYGCTMGEPGLIPNLPNRVHATAAAPRAAAVVVLPPRSCKSPLSHPLPSTSPDRRPRPPSGESPMAPANSTAAPTPLSSRADTAHPAADPCATLQRFDSAASMSTQALHAGHLRLIAVQPTHQPPQWTGPSPEPDSTDLGPSVAELTIGRPPRAPRPGQ